MSEQASAVDVPAGQVAPGERQVDAVLFDLGNVLIRWDPYLPYEGRFPREEVEAFFRESDFVRLNAQQDAGRPWAEIRAELAAARPDLVGMLDVYVADPRLALPGEVVGARETVEALRAAGLGVFGLTNWGAENFRVAPERAPVIDLLEGVVVSGHEKVAKPDPEIFRRAAARFDLEPARTLFTDDSARNVEAAAALGFRTHLFREHAGLRAHLRGLGVALPA